MLAGLEQHQQEHLATGQVGQILNLVQLLLLAVEEGVAAVVAVVLLV